MTDLAAVWQEAVADAHRLALAEGERVAARAIAAIPRPEILPASPHRVRRFALLYATVVARSAAQHWDISRQIADLPGGPSFGRSLASWEAWRLAWAQQHPSPDEPTASDWKDGSSPVSEWGAVWLLLLACLRPPHIRRRRPSVRISPRTRAMLIDLIRWSVQEIRRIAMRLAQRRIRPALVIAWSVWRRAHQAAAKRSHLKRRTQTQL